MPHPLWGSVEGRGLDYHLSRKCSVGIDWFFAVLAVVTAVLLR